MHETLQSICNSLDDLAVTIRDGYTGDNTMTEIWGWNFPALSRHDLSNMASDISDRLKEANITEIDQKIVDNISIIPTKIYVFKKQSFQYLYNGNGSVAAPTYLSLVEWIKNALAPLLDWQLINDNRALPNKLARRLRTMEVELDGLVPQKEELTKQIQLISEATEAAESLPTDIQSLKEARNKVDKFSTDSAELYGKIDMYHKNIVKLSESLELKKIEVNKIVDQCEEAYKITTTKGLAAAFDQRADVLSVSMYIWVGGLVAALVTGAWIGASRFQTLAVALKDKDPHWGVIWMDFGLSILGLAGPVWFAWLATKQISQRFKLAEDYSYKASVAKAYEGYRKEAARIDKVLEARLFSSALSRLEEAPLRLVESDNHSSPWSELLNSGAFKKVMETVPELKTQVIEVVKHGLSEMKGKLPSSNTP